MRKIPTIFERDWEGDKSRVTKEPATGVDWVFNDEGIPTEKHDGTACLIRYGKVFKRYQVKKGRIAPKDFEPLEEPDPKTGKQIGWVPVSPDNPADKYFREGIEKSTPPDGSYELIGPKVQGNKYNLLVHILVSHGSSVLQDCKRTYNDVKFFLEQHRIEGIVWHHPDGRMAKIKRRDFGLKW